MILNYPHRLLIDYEFVVELTNGDIFDSRTKFNMIKYLMYIKATSSINKGDHNVILEGEYTRLINNSVFADYEIKKIAKPTSLPNEFQSIHDPLTRNIYMGVVLTATEPWNCTILTSTSHEKDYLANRHFSALKDVTVSSGNKAYTDVKLMFNIFENTRRE